MSKIYQDLMLDIESLGNKKDFVITQIAAVAFDRNTGKTGPEFMINIDIEDSLKNGFTVDASTILWWMEQNDEARNGIVEGQKKAVRVDHALFELRAFIQSLEPSTLKIWGNGATFDISALKTYYYNMGAKTLPWKHTLERDVRTIVEFAPDIKAKWLDNFEGVKHDPIADCKNQIGYVSAILDYITANENIARTE
jgi:hypothetical protein